jgi:hypothetical protein
MHTGDLHTMLSGIIRDAFFNARNDGETMYKASDDAAAHVLAVLAPSTLRLQAEVTKLLEQWEIDRRGYPTGSDWQAVIADITVKNCIAELQAAVRRSEPTELKLEAI